MSGRVQHKVLATQNLHPFVKYFPANAAALSAITGMVQGEGALQLDTDVVYKYNGSAWTAGGLGGGIISKTYTEAQALITASGLIAGSLYKITDRGDLGLILLATQANAFGLSGQGGFLNADFRNAGTYPDVPGFTTQRGMWDTTLVTVELDDVTGFGYADTVNNQDQTGNGTIYRVDGSTIYLKDVNGKFSTGDSIESSSGSVTTASADGTVSNTYVTGDVVVAQNQSTGAWNHYVKLTDDFVSGRPEDDGTNWNVLDRTIGTGFIVAWDYTEYDFAKDDITQRNDKDQNKLTFNKSYGPGFGDMISTGFPFGMGGDGASPSAFGNTIGEFSTIRILYPMDYFQGVSAPTGWFTLFVYCSQMNLDEGQVQQDTTLYLTADHGFTKSFNDFILGGENNITHTGRYPTNPAISGLVTFQNCAVSNNGFVLNRVMVSSGFNLSATANMDSQFVGPDPQADNNFDTQGARKADIDSRFNPLNVSEINTDKLNAGSDVTDKSAIVNVFNQNGFQVKEKTQASIDQTPTDIPTLFGAKLLIYCPTKSLAGTDGDPTPTLPDISGNGYDCTTQGILTPPVLATDAVSGNRMLDFSGGERDLQNLAVPIPSVPFTIFAIVKPQSSPAMSFLNAIIANYARNMGLITSGDDNFGHGNCFSLWNSGNPILALNGAVDINSTQPYLVIARLQSSSQISGRVDSRTGTLQTGMTLNTWGTGIILGHLPTDDGLFNGLLGDFGIIIGDLTEDEIKKLNDRILYEWQIAEMSAEYYGDQSVNMKENRDKTGTLISGVDKDAGLFASKANFGGIPTSPSGLASGDMWVDTTGGFNILKIV